MSEATTAWPVMSIAKAHALLTAPGSAFEMETVEVEGHALRTWRNAPRSLAQILLASRAHGERDKVRDRRLGLGNLLYNLTDPKPDAPPDWSQLGDVSEDEALAALRAEARRRGNNVRAREASGAKRGD